MTTMTICGVWEGGMLKNGVDVCITYAEDGRCYFGDHADSIPHGEFEMHHSSSHDTPPRRFGLAHSLHVPFDISFALYIIYSGASSPPSGFGRMVYADRRSGKSTYTGWFVNGVRQGLGKCFFHRTGEEYDGEWACDEPIGLKIFQHQGPFTETPCLDASCTSCVPPFVGGGDATRTTQYTPQTLSSFGRLSLDGNRPRRRLSQEMLSSSTISVSTESSCNGGPCPSVMDESAIALSGLENVTIATRELISDSNNAVIAPVPRIRTKKSRLRVSTAESDIMSSMKSLAVFDFSEECVRLYKYQNGDTFEGYLDKFSGLRQGSGVYTEHRMGSTYNGDWRDSKRHGAGHLRLASGVEYKGEFFEDKIHGQGSLTIGGSVYTVSIVIRQYQSHDTQMF